MFSIVIPIYNESKNILSLFSEIQKNLKHYKNYEIIYVNDFSNDDSLFLLEDITKKNKNIKILNNNKNEGQSFSIYQGVQNTIYDTIVTIDGDGQNNPKDMNQLLKIFFSNKEVSLVGGLRYKRKDSLIKIFSSRLANYIRSSILNDECSDTGCSLKVFDKKIFLDFPYFDGMHRFLPALFKGFGHKAIYVEVDHRHRKYGESKYGTFDRLYKGIFDIIKVKKILNNKNK